MPDDDKVRQGRESFDVGEWFGAGVLFFVVWFFTKTYHPEDEHHVLMCGIVLFVCAVLYAVARKFLSDVKLTVVLTVSVVLGFLLLFLVPHGALVEHTPKTQFGKVLLMAFDGLAIVVLFLAVVSVYVDVRGGGKRWRWFAERFPSLSEFTWGLAEGIVPLVLLCALAEIVWRLTA